MKLKLFCQKQPYDNFVMAIALHPSGQTFGSCCNTKKEAVESVKRMISQTADIGKFSFEEVESPNDFKF